MTPHQTIDETKKLTGEGRRKTSRHMIRKMAM